MNRVHNYFFCKEKNEHLDWVFQNFDMGFSTWIHYLIKILNFKNQKKKKQKTLVIQVGGANHLLWLKKELDLRCLHGSIQRQMMMEFFLQEWKKAKLSIEKYARGRHSKTWKNLWKMAFLNPSWKKCLTMNSS